MSKSSQQVAAMAAGLMLFVAASVQAQTARIQAGQATGMPGQTVMFDVVLDTGGLAVVGTQNDITFAPETPINVGSNNRPACTANAALMKEASQFAFQPPGCSGATCTGIRAIILSFQNTDVIPNGSTLYTCTVGIAADAPAGNYTLSVTGASSSDKDGNALPTQGQDGQIVVSGGTTSPVNIIVGNAQGAAGATTSFDVTLQTTAEPVGTQNDIAFPADAIIPAGTNNRPACQVNPDLMKEASQFAFQPPGCTPGTSCTAIRAIILSFQNTDPIPNGARLYTCTVNIGATSTGGPLTCSGASSSDKDGGAIDTSCQNGQVIVGGGIGTPTATGTAGGPTSTATVNRTPTVTPPTSTTGTATVTRTSGTPGTATVTRTPTIQGTTPTSARILEDDGCAVVSPIDATSGWMLLLPAAALLWLRRRTR